MSQIDTRINAHLRSSTGLVALVGSEIRTAALDSTGDGLLAAVVDTYQGLTMGSLLGVAESQLQVTSFSRSFANAHAIAIQARKSLERWNSSTAGVRDTLLEDENHLYDGDWYEIIQDYRVIHTT